MPKINYISFQKPKHHRGGYRSYSNVNMEEALKLVEKGVTMYKASKVTGMPRYYLLDKHASGPDRLFTEEDEQSISNHVKKNARFGYGYSRQGMRILATDTAVFLKKRQPSDSMLSDKWL